MSSISSINTTSSAAAVSSGSSSAITSETKKKLQALGLNPDDYKTEASAKTAITQKQQELQASKEAQSGQSGQSGNSSDFEDQVDTLAQSVGVDAKSESDVGKLLDDISAKISQMQLTATDDDKKSEITGYQTQYQELEDEYSQMQSAQNMTGATAQGTYNKAALGLS